MRRSLAAVLERRRRKWDPDGMLWPFEVPTIAEVDDALSALATVDTLPRSPAEPWRARSRLAQRHDLVDPDCPCRTPPSSGPRRARSPRTCLFSRARSFGSW